jgi:hypothetical protein
MATRATTMVLCHSRPTSGWSVMVARDVYRRTKGGVNR